MKAKRLGHTAKQLAEHQLGVTAENDEEAKWLAELVLEYMKGSAFYPVGFNGDEQTKIWHLSISTRQGA